MTRPLPLALALSSLALALACAAPAPDAGGGDAAADTPSVAPPSAVAVSDTPPASPPGAYVDECRTGPHQSPIGIPREGPRSTGAVSARLPTLGGKLFNKRGHSIQVDLADGGAFVLAGETFPLLEFHVHTPAEHVRLVPRPGGTDTVRPPADVHLVGRSRAGRIAVVGTWVEEGETGHVFWNELAERAPATPRDTVPLEPFSLAEVFGIDRLEGERLYRYTGSLTTPPCTGNVLWLVRDRPLVMQADAVATLLGITGPNARKLQPNNGRVVQVHPGR